MGERVVIGMDPHKRSVTVEVMEADERVVGHGRFGTDAAGFSDLVGYAKAWPERVWAVEGCEGIGRHVAQRLLAAGERVVDVPAKLSARMRVFATGQGRKTDDTDAHSIALVGVRVTGLQPVVANEQLEMLRLLVDRQERIAEDHTRMTSQLHRLLLELVPGGAKRFLSVAQARRILAGVRPTGEVGRLRKRVAAELVADLERLHERRKKADKELAALVGATSTGLVDLRGIGPYGAARIMVEVGDVARFPDKGHFASWTGTAPVDVSSGDTKRHRLSRGGNRQINRVLHIMAVTQLRYEGEGRDYFNRKRAAGKSPNEAMRCLKRRLSDIVYRALLNDHAASKATGPGGHRGTTLTSSVTGSQPHTGTSDKPLPGPVSHHPTTPHPKAS